MSEQVARMSVSAKANRDWREDPQRCYMELLESKSDQHRAAMNVELFMSCLSGTQARFIYQLKEQFIFMRTGH